jgi:2-polyprenyl-3-methyl-5-hydroxy-6-metoxy-1,4-benzoquinol methylase
MEVLSNCPKCHGAGFSSYLTCKDFTVTGELFNIVSCNQCGFLFTNPRPDSNSIGKYYQSENYISHSNTKKGIVNKIYHFIKKIAINSKIELLEGLKPASKRLLDIGCGTGAFLGEINKRGWDATGIEPSNDARQFAIKTYGISVFGEEKLQELKPGSFSIITMWHVLEHVHQLKNRVEEIYNLLEKGGYAIIAVPNHTSWDAANYKELWAAYDVPRHLYHFSPQSIKELFNIHNLTHIQSLPMQFDSFYVSMLSEKYKGSTLGIVSAFFSGLFSNLKAKNDAEKFSSVIYIFQKK